MTLYFRLVIILFKIWLGSKIHPLDQSTVHFRALPTDCDLNLHMTTSRYPAFMDAATIHLMGQMGILGRLLRRHCFPINSNIAITYIRSIKSFERFTVVSRIVTWDDKHWYKEHRFEVDGELRAFAMARGVVVCRRATASMGDITALTGEELAVPPFSETVLKWNEFLETKKAHSSQATK